MGDQPKPDDDMSIPPQSPPPDMPEPNDAPIAQPATAQQLEQAETNIETRMSAFERSMLRLTRAGIIIAALTGFIFVGQLYEMWDTGQQTNKLVDAANKQAAAADSFSKSADRIDTKIAQTEEDFQTIANSTKTQGQIMRQQLDLSERPWIVSEFVPTFLSFKEDGGFLGLRITLTNIGHSTAESITTWTKLSVSERTYLSEGEINCGYPKLPVNKNYRGGSVLFPGQQSTFEQPAAAAKEAIENALTAGDFKDMHMVTIHVLTCIDYRSTLDSRHHQTRKFFTLVRPDPVTHVFMGVFDPHGNYDPSAFRMLPGGWDQAD